MNNNTTTELNETPAPVAPFNTAMKWALVGFMLAVIVTMANVYMNDGSYNPRSGGWILGVLNMLIMIVPMVLMMKEYRDKVNGGYMSYGNAFRAGFLYSLLTVAFTILFLFVLYNFIIDYDTFVAEQLDITIKALKERGMTDEAIKTNLEKAPKWMSAQWFSLSSAAVGSLVIYTILVLILAAIFKRNRPEHA